MRNNIALESTILLVDDDIDLLEVIKETIEDHFGTVLTADRGQKALDLLKTTHVDCIITDYRMPEMNGLELIEKLKKTHSSIPVILLTGNGSDPLVVKSLESGLYDYLDKPFKAPVLLNRIRNALLLPRLESLIFDLAKTEFPELPVDKFMSAPYDERLKMLSGLEAIIRTRILAKSGKKSA